ncbi:MAG TPA: MBL fold metallo-hydrolase [Gaiellaceae bacterium]|nr:MBL fold metallo-hydrolase [Gaiellaceae bacterium]
MRATIWGCRGSLATPGERTVRYGGNTSSVELRSASGRLVILDAGTGIRPLGLSLREVPDRIDLLLTHLHLDHVEGLGFFAPLFASDRTITIWGPPQEGTPLADWIAKYLSPPFFPRRFEELPSKIEFVELGEETWHLDGLNVTSARVTHPGTTLGYRIEEEGRTFTYIPDNELGLKADSGAELAESADLLFHDAQYTHDEYGSRVGWGHSSIDDVAAYLRAMKPGKAVMFHHDPAHSDDFLESMRATVEEKSGTSVELAAEQASYEV